MISGSAPRPINGLRYSNGRPDSILQFLETTFGSCLLSPKFFRRVLVYSVATTLVPFLLVVIVNLYVPFWWWLGVPQARENVLHMMLVSVPAKQIPFYLSVASVNYILDLLGIICLLYMRAG